MTVKTIAAIAFAASTLLISASAEAGNRHGDNYGGNRGGYHERHHNHYRWDRHHHYATPYFGFYVSDFEPYQACRYLEKKARHTGSHYWWRKYKRCIIRYY